MFWSMRLSVILLPQSRGFDDGVLCLGVSDGGVVSYARVGADEGVDVDLAVVPDYERSSYRSSAVDDCAFSYCHVVRYCCMFHNCPLIMALKALMQRVIRLQHALRLTACASASLSELQCVNEFMCRLFLFV